MSDAGYTGNQVPTTDQTPFGAHAFLAQSILNRAATIEIVMVKAVHGGGVDVVGTVDVQPMVHQINGQGQITPHGVVYGLPYMRIQGGTNAVIIDPQVGDIGMAAFCSRDISTVKTTKAPAAPGSRRRQDWADGLYIGGFLNGIPTQYVFFSDDGVKVLSPTKVTLHAPTTAVEGDLTVTGQVTAQGEVTGNGIALSTHVHSGVTGGPDDTGEPVS